MAEKDKANQYIELQNQARENQARVDGYKQEQSELQSKLDNNDLSTDELKQQFHADTQAHKQLSNDMMGGMSDLAQSEKELHQFQDNNQDPSLDANSIESQPQMGEGSDPTQPKLDNSMGEGINQINQDSKEGYNSMETVEKDSLSQYSIENEPEPNADEKQLDTQEIGDGQTEQKDSLAAYEVAESKKDQEQSIDELAKDDQEQER